MDQLAFPGMPTPTEREVAEAPTSARLQITLHVMPDGSGTLSQAWEVPVWGSGREVEFVQGPSTPTEWHDRVAVAVFDHLPAIIDPF